MNEVSSPEQLAKEKPPTAEEKFSFLFPGNKLEQFPRATKHTLRDLLKVHLAVNKFMFQYYDAVFNKQADFVGRVNYPYIDRFVMEHELYDVVPLDTPPHPNNAAKLLNTDEHFGGIAKRPVGLFFFKKIGLPYATATLFSPYDEAQLPSRAIAWCELYGILGQHNEPKGVIWYHKTKPQGKLQRAPVSPIFIPVQPLTFQPIPVR